MKPANTKAGTKPSSQRARTGSRVIKVGSPASKPLAAFVLHQYDWSESSLIVELFTREQGRVVVVARGAKRPTSNFRALILPFVPLQLLLGKTPADDSAEVMPLRSAEWIGGVPLMPGAGLLSGFYLNELLLKLLARQDPHPALFDAYARTLVTLALAPEDGAVLRAFELRLLRELGLLPDLSQETLTAQALRPGQRYAVDPEHGLQPDAQGVAAATWLAAEEALAAADTVALRQACSGSGVAAGLRGPLRQLLHYHLGQRPLRTRQVLQGLQRLAEAPQIAKRPSAIASEDSGLRQLP